MKSTLVLLFLFLNSCGVYSLTGANIAGKTILISSLENKAPNVNPTLATTLENKVRSRILSQTGLTSINSDNADYELKGTITGYTVTVSGAQSNTVASQNRLTITLQVDFVNKLDKKASFNQTFSRFQDFSANQQLQSVEDGLIEKIGNELADDIFNKAFVNW